MFKLMMLQQMTTKMWTGKKVDEKIISQHSKVRGLVLQSCFCKIMCMLIPLILVHHSSIPGSQNINFEGMNLYSTNGSSYITDISAIMLVFSFISGGLNGGKLHYNFFFFFIPELQFGASGEVKSNVLLYC